MRSQRMTIALMGAILGLAACGGGGEAASSAPAAGGDDCSVPAEATAITVGTITAIDVAAFQVAQDEGYFEDEGLQVTGQPFATGAAATAAVLSGDVQVGWGAVNSSLAGLSQGVPIVALAPGSYSNVDENDSGGIVVAGDSDIRSIEDLAGKTVAIIAQKSLADLQARAALADSGVDLSTVDFVEIGFADIGPAIAAGRIDAGLTQEPFVTILESQGYRVVGRPVSILFDEATQMTEWITSERYAEEEPCVVERYQRAIGAANKYTAEHPDAAREAIRTLIPAVPAPIVDQLTLPTWRADSDRGSYEAVLELMREHGGYDFEPDLDEYLRLTKAG